MIFQVPSHLNHSGIPQGAGRGWHVPRAMQVEGNCPGSEWPQSWGRRQLQLALTKGCGENKKEQKLGGGVGHAGDGPWEGDRRTGPLKGSMHGCGCGWTWTRELCEQGQWWKEEF